MLITSPVDRRYLESVSALEGVSASAAAGASALVLDTAGVCAQELAANTHKQTRRRKRPGRAIGTYTPYTQIGIGSDGPLILSERRIEKQHEHIAPIVPSVVV